MILKNGQFRVVFSPKNFEASVAFYKEGLALPVDHEWDYGGGDRGAVFLAGGGMVEALGLHEGQEYVAPQGIGLLIEVEDADRWLVLARDRGLNVIQEPVSYPWGHRILRLLDPDGITVSLFSVIRA